MEQVTLFGSMVRERNRDKDNPLCAIVSLMNSDFSLFLYLGTHPVNADGIVNRTVCVV